jgi:hypothetical protein
MLVFGEEPRTLAERGTMTGNGLHCVHRCARETE